MPDSDSGPYIPDPTGPTDSETKAAHDPEEIFPYGHPYPDQQRGIETCRDLCQQNGFAVIEGECGTGKTLMAMTAALSVVRDPDTPQTRILAITNNKQQITAFEDDAESINDAARAGEISADPISGVSLVGKADLCPYVQEGPWEPETVYSNCTSLRSNTRSAAKSGTSDYVTNAMQIVNSASSPTTRLGMGDVKSPYPPEPVEHNGSDVCPFYAQFKADDESDVESIPVTDRLLSREQLIADAVSYGTCPHSAMHARMTDAELVIGNYYHAFDPVTVESFTDPLIDEETILIIDEAHGLIESIRDELSVETSLIGLTQAISDASDVADAWSGSRPGQALMSSIMGRKDIHEDELDSFIEFLEAVASTLRTRAMTELQHQSSAGGPPYFDVGDTEIPLREPDTPQVDSLTTSLRTDGWGEEVWIQAEHIGEAVEEAYKALRSEVMNDPVTGSRSVRSAGRILTNWQTENHEEYYREIRVQDRGTHWDDAPSAWQATHKATLRLNNCVPSDRIASRLDDMGAGIIMSATLAPMDVYQQIIGLPYLTDRPTGQELFGLSFPEENRQTLAVNLPKFNWKNRDAPQIDNITSQLQQNNTRKQYLSAAHTGCEQIPGNVLVIAPSYTEAEWFGTGLEPRLDKDVLIDESSTDAETTALLEEFFAGEGKVLVTGALGTLTEGVDYSGDKLHGAIVAGLPVRNRQSEYGTALITAYTERFGGHGFNYALTIPAVRKARQAIGRVIRGESDIGTRLFLDRRYTPEGGRGAAHPHFPSHLADEVTTVAPDQLSASLSQFWARHA